MKDGYKYENGLVKVVDYNENNVRTFETRDYRDNINELLMTENEIEHLQSKKNYYCEQKARINKKLDAFVSDVALWVGMYVIFFILGWMLSLALFFENLSIIHITIVGLICRGGFCLSSSSSRKEISKLDKQLQGVESILQGIEEKLEDNIVLMRNLENDTRREKEEEVKKSTEYKQLGCVEKLNEVDEYLDLWYDAGFNESDISYYEREETLDTYLASQYCEEDAKTMKKIISRRKKIRKNEERNVD